MAENQVNQVIEALKPLAEKFGQGAEQFFALAVKAVYISAFENILWMALFIGFMPKLWKWAKNEDIDDVARGFSGFGFAVCCVLVVVCLNCFAENILNPQYSAISNILGMITPKAK